MNNQNMKWDTQYEWKAVLLLAIGFGLVGLDRWIITPVFPVIMQELHLSYQDLGNAVGALAIVWGVAAIWMGRLSDLIGRRRVAIPALILFSLMSAFTGMVNGIAGLLLIRALMGATEGAFTPACTAAAGEASAPERRGRGQGFVFCAFPLLGLGLGPIIATQLLAVVPSWRWVFYVVAVPGLILAVLLYFVLRDPVVDTSQPKEKLQWSVAVRSRNVRLATLNMLCAMSCIFVLSAMVPSYLVDYLKVSPTTMGFIMSSLGFGGCVGNFLMPVISDYIGRRATALGAAVIAILALILLTRLGAETMPLYITLFVISMFSFGIMATSTGPIAIEAVAPGLASSAIGIVSGAGEIFGGGIAPIIAGFVADHYGIEKVLYIGIVGLAVAVVTSLFLIETAPRILARHRAG